MGISDVLRGMTGGGGDQKAPAVGLPGFDAGSQKALTQMSKQLKEINKLVKSGKGDWKAYAKVDPLRKAAAATAGLKKAQQELTKMQKSGTASLHQLEQGYLKVAKTAKESKEAIKDANREMNETKGIAGRAKNVLDDVFELKGPLIFAAAMRDLQLITKDMSQNFNQLASRGQLANQSLGELAKTTALYSYEMKMASLSAAAVGIGAEESNAAFAKLTNTYGGNAKAVEQVSNEWKTLTTLAMTTGVGLESVSDLAASGYARLGESLEEVEVTVARVGSATKEMNDRFGAAAPTAQMMSKAVTELSYAQGFYNQNTNMVVDTLAREVSMQLALGRTQEAAVAKAQKNLELAGQVNLVGITQFRDQIQADFAAAEAAGTGQDFLADLARDFGAEGEIIASMLEDGNLQASGSLLAVEQLFKNSSKMQDAMMEKMRASAAEGNVSALLGIGIPLADAQIMIREGELLNKKIEKIRSGDKGDAIKALNLGPEKMQSKEVKKFIKDVKGGEMKPAELQAQFRKISGAGDSTAEVGKPQDEVDQWMGKTGTDVAWFAAALNMFKTVPELLGTLPLNFGTVMAGLLAKNVLGGLLKNIGGKGIGNAMGRGIGSMGGAIGRGLPGMTSMKGMSKMGKLGQGALVGLAIAGAMKLAEGFSGAAEIMSHIPAEQLTFADKMAAAGANLLGDITGADKNMLGRWMAGGMFGEDPLAPTGNEGGPVTRQMMHAQKVSQAERSGKEYTETFEQFNTRMDRIKAAQTVPISVAGRGAEASAEMAKPAGGGVPSDQQPPGRGGEMVGTQTGEGVDSQGNMTATVTFSKASLAAGNSAVGGEAA